MAKVLKCRDVGVNCDFEAHGATVEEIMSKAAEHAKTCHTATKITPELQQKIIGAIKDAPGSCCSH